MKIIGTKFVAMTSVVTASLAAACAGLSNGSPYERAAALPADGGLIVFSAGAAGDRPVKRVQYVDNEQRVEYALYKGNGAQAEFVFMERPYNLNVAFNFECTIADKVATWNYSKGQPIEWRDAGRVRTKLGEVFYRPYKLTAMNQDCVGISGRWAAAPDDREQRPTRIMFGYYCASAGRPLGNDETLALVNRIGLRGVTAPAADYADPIRNFDRDVATNYAGPEASRKAIGTARGDADAAGIAGFPFRYAEYYDSRHGHGGQ